MVSIGGTSHGTVDAEGFEDASVSLANEDMVIFFLGKTIMQ